MTNRLGGDAQGIITIRDVALRAGVSRSAVSLAVNGRPGVSDATRERVVAAAAELGWRPNRAARALRGIGSDTVGLVIVHPPNRFGAEPFWMQFIAGIEGALVKEGHALRLCLASDTAHEIEVHRAWWQSRSVAGAIVVNGRMNDERLPALHDLGMPVVLAAHPRVADGLPTEWTDDANAADTVVRYLAALGHRRIARVSNDPTMGHVALRSEAFARVASNLDLQHVIVSADPAGADPGQVTRRLLLGPLPPTAVLYDSNVLAIAALSVAKEMNIDVPDALNILAWHDSALCEIVQPPLTVVASDVFDYGARTARHLLRIVDGTAQPTPALEIPAIHPRGSTGVLRQRDTASLHPRKDLQ